MLAVNNNILEKHDLRNTPSRLSVLTVFNENNFAISHADIEKALKDEIDRVTIYRTLNTFLEKGIIHKVIDDSGVSKYAICVAECSENHHHDNHVHFKCQKCGNSECMNGISIPQLALPKGYVITESNLLIEGVCKHCS